MIIDEVDYDSTTPVGQSHIFSPMAKPKQAGPDAHTSENTRHVLSSKKAGGVMISTNTDERRKRSGAKAKKQATTLIVGRDISLVEVPDYLSSALVGRFCGKSVGETALHRWMEEHRSPLLQKLPMFHILSRGWILFRVKTETDPQTLPENNWQWWPSRLILKKWSVYFDANKESLNVQKVWAILPRLPMMFWQTDIMEAI